MRQEGRERHTLRLIHLYFVYIFHRVFFSFSFRPIRIRSESYEAVKIYFDFLIAHKLLVSFLHKLTMTETHLNHTKTEPIFRKFMHITNNKQINITNLTYVIFNVILYNLSLSSNKNFLCIESLMLQMAQKIDFMFRDIFLKLK